MQNKYIKLMTCIEQLKKLCDQCQSTKQIQLMNHVTYILHGGAVIGDGHCGGHRRLFVYFSATEIPAD